MVKERRDKARGLTQRIKGKGQMKIKGRQTEVLI